MRTFHFLKATSLIDGKSLEPPQAPKALVAEAVPSKVALIPSSGLRGPVSQQHRQQQWGHPQFLVCSPCFTGLC